MTPEQVIEFYGSEQAAADALSCTRQNVNLWLNRGKIPIRTQALIQLITRGKLKADLKEEGRAA